MNKSLRKVIIAGNWKMNKTPEETKDLISKIYSSSSDVKCEVVLCVPFVDISAALEASKDSNVRIGAQNCHWEKNGAFTGEISAHMLADMGVKYVIVGHSERRTLFGETDVTVNKRLISAISERLKVILCVGETLDQRENEITKEIVSMQTKLALKNVSRDDMEQIIVAYEPVWAIGTGKTATSQQADEVCSEIRNVISELYDQECADKMTIQYGGSMNASNAAELLKMENIDGGLIGGASLKPEDFKVILESAN